MTDEERKELSKKPFMSKHENDTLSDTIQFSIRDLTKLHIFLSQTTKIQLSDEERKSFRRLAALHAVFAVCWSAVVAKQCEYLMGTVAEDDEFWALFEASNQAHLNLPKIDMNMLHAVILAKRFLRHEEIKDEEVVLKPRKKKKKSIE